MEFKEEGELLLTKGFPNELFDDVGFVLDNLFLKTVNNTSIGATEQICTYRLLSGEKIYFPYRIYYIDEMPENLSQFTFRQRMIYHAIFTRSYNGYVREKHIKAILSEDFPHWIIPYIVKLSDEYVMEILNTVYEGLKNKDTTDIKEFCKLNLQSFVCSHNRMISYWNEFYRTECFRYKNYIGERLFLECFGYTRSMEMERE